MFAHPSMAPSYQVDVGNPVHLSAVVVWADRIVALLYDLRMQGWVDALQGVSERTLASPRGIPCFLHRTGPRPWQFQRLLFHLPEPCPTQRSG